MGQLTNSFPYTTLIIHPNMIKVNDGNNVADSTQQESGLGIVVLLLQHTKSSYITHKRWPYENID